MKSPDLTIKQMGEDDFFIAPGRESLAPQGVVRREKGDPAGAMDSVGEVFCDNEVILHDPSAQLQFKHALAMIGPTAFNQLTYGAKSEVVVRERNRKQYIFLLPLRGEMPVETEKGFSTLAEGSFMLMGPEAVYRFGQDEVSSHLAIGFDRTKIEAGGAGPGSLTHGLDPQRLTRQAEGLVDYAGYLCRELNRGPEIFQNPLMARAVENTLVAFIQEMQTADAIPRNFGGPVPSFVYLAERFMDQHLCDDITGEQISAASGAPSRTLYHAFTHFRGMPPMRMLRQKRLERARIDITAEALAGSVNILDVANRYCMQHGGRFAAYYLEHFNEAPSETARVARYKGRPDPARF